MNDFGMHDLLQKQINESCHLALPDGLQDLMYDISREVLRAQPANVYSFITNYLAALLVTRENLAVASRVCAEVCESICHLGLKDDLLEIGLTEEEVDAVKETVEEYFAAGDVKEGNLLMKLMKKTEIDGEMLPAIQTAIRRAFLRYQAHNTTRYESSSDSDMDEVTRAAHHTMKLYRHTKPSENEMEKAATRIQSAYRAYGVRREKLVKKPASKPTSKVIRFGNIESDQCSIIYSESDSNSDSDAPYYPPPEKTDSYNSDISKMVLHPSLQFKEQILSVSSTSLAGSFIKLPKHVPYSAHEKDTLFEMDEHNEIEKEGTIDYTTLAEKKSSSHKHKSNDSTTKKAISFHSMHDLINNKISLVLNDEEHYKKGIECEEIEVINDEEQYKRDTEHEEIEVLNNEEHYKRDVEHEEIDDGIEQSHSVTNFVDSKATEVIDKDEISDALEVTEEQKTDADTDTDHQQSEFEDIPDEFDETFDEDTTENAIYFENDYIQNVPEELLENNEDITGDMGRLIDEIDEDF